MVPSSKHGWKTFTIERQIHPFSMARVPEGFTNQRDSPSNQGGVYHGKYQLLITGIYPATIVFTEPKCGLPPSPEAATSPTKKVGP
jgi:hypothetical protein